MNMRHSSTLIDIEAGGDSYLSLFAHRLFSRRWYDPLKKETNLNAPALKKWLANGAQPSDTVKSLLQKAFVIEPEPIKVFAPKKTAAVPPKV